MGRWPREWFDPGADADADGTAVNWRGDWLHGDPPFMVVRARNDKVMDCGLNL